MLDDQKAGSCQTGDGGHYCAWHRDETKERAKRRPGEADREGDNSQNRNQQNPAGAASEGVSGGSDHKDDERLGCQRFDEPGGTKQRRVGGGVTAEEQDAEGEEIVDRTDGADDHHELPDEADLPAPGAGQERGVHVVSGDAELGGIAEEIVEQDLRGEHGEKGQEQRRPGHTEHVAEVGTAAHHDVLHDSSALGPSRRRRRFASSDVRPAGVASSWRSKSGSGSSQNAPGGAKLVRPKPGADFRHIVAVLHDVVFVFEQLITLG